MFIYDYDGNAVNTDHIAQVVVELTDDEAGNIKAILTNHTEVYIERGKEISELDTAFAEFIDRLNGLNYG